MKTLFLILILVCGVVLAQITSGPKIGTVSGTSLSIAPLDTVAIYQRGFAAGVASVVCPPVGYTKAQLDSAYNTGINLPIDSVFYKNKNGLLFRYTRVP